MIQRSEGMAGSTIRKMKEEPKHTPTPWKLIGRCIADKNGMQVAHVDTGYFRIEEIQGELPPEYTAEESDANARHIVRAVNRHDELVNELREVIANEGGNCPCVVCDRRRALLTKATGGTNP